MSKSDINAPRIWYDPQTTEYVVFGRQPMFAKNGKAQEIARFPFKSDAYAKLKEVLAKDAKQTRGIL